MNQFRMFTFFTVLLITVFTNSGFAGSATRWNVDNSHTQIRFSVNHFFTPVDGKFDDYKVDLWFDPDNFKGSSIEVTINVKSINTGNDKRDGYLQSPDLFNAEKFPVMTFKSNEIVSTGDNNFVAKGTLKIKDVSKEIGLPFTLLGVKELPEDMQKMFGALKRLRVSRPIIH